VVGRDRGQPFEPLALGARVGFCGAGARHGIAKQLLCEQPCARSVLWPGSLTPASGLKEAGYKAGSDSV
jgi:hypothetical protein